LQRKNLSAFYTDFVTCHPGVIIPLKTEFYSSLEGCFDINFEKQKVKPLSVILFFNISEITL